MENPYGVCVQNFLRKLMVKEFCKSVYICRNYDQKSRVFLTHSVDETNRPKQGRSVLPSANLRIHTPIRHRSPN